MKITKKILITVFVLTISSSCKEPDPLSPINWEQENPNFLDKGGNTLTVMTRNIYIGTDVDKIMLIEDPYEIPFVVADVFQGLLATDFPARAEALANEIYEQQPHLIGLQEVTLIRNQSPGDAIEMGTVLAEEVLFDYLEILLTAMRGMGLDYEVVAKIENVDVEMPMITSEAPTFDDVRLTDYDVILAKKGVAISEVASKNYETIVVIPEMGLELQRGYVAVTAEVNNIKYRFVNTHLEDADDGGILLQIQQAQAAELLAELNNVTIPIILVGDFNSAAPSEPTYKMIKTTPKFKDTWLLNKNPKDIDGFTYGHDLDLLNTEQNFWKRIDYIFVRNGKKENKNLNLKCVDAEVLGDEISDKTPSGLWPSDHGGVVANLKFVACKNYKCKREK